MHTDEFGQLVFLQRILVRVADLPPLGATLEGPANEFLATVVDLVMAEPDYTERKLMLDRLVYRCTDSVRSALDGAGGPVRKRLAYQLNETGPYNVWKVRLER